MDQKQTADRHLPQITIWVYWFVFSNGPGCSPRTPFTPACSGTQWSCVYLKSWPEPRLSLHVEQSGRDKALLLWNEQPSVLNCDPDCISIWFKSTAGSTCSVHGHTNHRFPVWSLKRNALLLWLIMYQLINLLALVNWINYLKWLLIVNICLITKEKILLIELNMKTSQDQGWPCKINYFKFPIVSLWLPKSQ